MQFSRSHNKKLTGVILSTCSFFKIGTENALKRIFDSDIIYFDYDEVILNEKVNSGIDLIVMYLASDPKSVISTIFSLGKLRSQIRGSNIVIISDLSCLWVTETIMSFIGANCFPSQFYFVQKKHLDDFLIKGVIKYVSMDELAGDYFKAHNINKRSVMIGLSLEEMYSAYEMFKTGKSKYNAIRNLSRSSYYRHRNNAIRKMRSISREFAYFLPKERNYLQFTSSVHNEFETSFLKALNANDVFPYYQPIINHENKLYGFELLCRWKVNNVVQAPSLFFHKLTSLYIWRVLTLKMIETAVSNIVESNGNHYFSVNVPSLLMNDSLFFDSCFHICSFIKENGWIKKLIFEISENTVFDKSDYVIKNIQELMNFGCQVFLDDCFSECSSLFPVKRIVFSGYKIDKSLIDSFKDNENHRFLIKNMVHYCSLVGSICVAEGIDTLDKFLMLREDNVCYFQGYHISHPVSYQEMKSIINKSII